MPTDKQMGGFEVDRRDLGIMSCIKKSIRALVASVIVILPLPASAVSSDTEVTITGGGWGHGIGMPQYGALGMAEDDYSYEEILAYFYKGTGLADVSATTTPPPNPIKVGVDTTFTSLDFEAIGGMVRVVVPDGGPFSADPTEKWNISHDGTGCVLTAGSSSPYGPGSCDIALEWDQQPDIRVSFPDVGRAFARGRVTFNEVSGGFHIVVEVGLEEYVYGIGEVPLSWPDEALKAQAVAARTFGARVAAVRSIRSDCSCLLRWNTKDQVYHGWTSRTEGNQDLGQRWKAAVDGTVGEVAVSPAGGSKMAETYYFSNSGGATENVSDIWGSNQANYPYLVTRPDPWSGLYADSDCTKSRIRWCKTLTAGQISAALDLDELASMQILAVYESGSPSDILVTGFKGGLRTDLHFTGSQLRSKLGLNSHYITNIAGDFSAGTSSPPSQPLVGDFTGNGKDDVLTYSEATGHWAVGGSTGSSFNNSTWAQFSTRSGWSDFLVGDFTGDGRADVAVYHRGSGRWWMGRSTGSSFDFDRWASFSAEPGWSATLAGDFDGDRRDDIAAFDPATGEWWVLRSTGSSFSPKVWTIFSTRTGWEAHSVGDFDGDGRDDIGNFKDGRWWVSRSRGSSFTTSRWTDFSTRSGWEAHLVGDFDGDGRSDIGDFKHGRWWVSRFSGSTFTFSWSRWTDFSTRSGWQAHVVGDFNGDGRADIGNFKDGRWWVSRSTGSSFTTSRWTDFATRSGWEAHLVGDFNGDGRDDIANFKDGRWWVSLSTGSDFATSGW